jgi:glycosyltransferase involved in cell wall biosynthesis
MKKKLKVLVCLGGYNPELAGGAKQQENIIKKLKKKVEFNIISFSRLYDDKISFKKKKIYRIKRYSNFLIIKSILKIIVYFFSIRNDFDVLHLRGGAKRVILLIFLGKLLGKKILYTPTRYKEDDLYTLKKDNKIIYFFLKKINFLHCMSPIFFKSKNSFVKNFNLIHLPNLVDTSIFRKFKKKKKKIPNILCVGFFSNIKNQMLLYKAWCNVVKKNECTLTFVGKKKIFNYYLSENQIYKKIIKDAKSRKIFHKIKFINHSNNMHLLYNQSDVFVLPSQSEGMPNSLLEAMSCNLPCITTNLKNITSQIIINKKNGYLFKNNNQKDLEKCLFKLLRSNSLRNLIGNRARSHIENKYSFKKNIYKYEKMYNLVSQQNLSS